MRTENKNTILIVEDDFIIAMDEKIALEEYGYDVLTAKSGEAAIEIMRGNHPVDLILMDIDLGTGMDGIATAETILKFREIPIAFLSSHTALEIAEKTAKISLCCFHQVHLSTMPHFEAKRPEDREYDEERNIEVCHLCILLSGP